MVKCYYLTLAMLIEYAFLGMRNNIFIMDIIMFSYLIVTL